MDRRQETANRAIDIELLALNLTACGRCGGTLANVEKAIEIVGKALEATGIEIRLRKIVVESEEQARQHGFRVSPTIRIDGRDLAVETLESRCGDCTDLSGAEEGTVCRVWSYRGERHTEAPVGLVVEALLAEIGRGAEARPAAEPITDREVPENLRRFFASRASTSSGQGGARDTKDSPRSGCGCG